MVRLSERDYKMMNRNGISFWAEKRGVKTSTARRYIRLNKAQPLIDSYYKRKKAGYEYTYYYGYIPQSGSKYKAFDFEVRLLRHKKYEKIKGVLTEIQPRSLHSLEEEAKEYLDTFDLTQLNFTLDVDQTNSSGGRRDIMFGGKETEILWDKRYNRIVKQ